ncbi:MAG: hypothetical protein AAFX99_22870, partial [Myxococcota bacterium]
ASCEPTGVCEGRCAVECRSNRDCPGNWLCESFTDGQGARCRLQDQDACRTTSDCPQGQRCIRDGNAFARCLPDLDVRGLDSEGRGVWCGCDAECPGGQSCVRMEVDLTDGFCALRCRDDRDCPDAWSCLGLTASGLSSICVPSDM